MLTKVICDDGMLFLKRRLVQADAVLTFPDKSNFMNCNLEFDEGKEDLANIVKNGQVQLLLSCI